MITLFDNQHDPRTRYIAIGCDTEKIILKIKTSKTYETIVASVWTYDGWVTIFSDSENMAWRSGWYILKEMFDFTEELFDA